VPGRRKDVALGPARGRGREAVDIDADVEAHDAVGREPERQQTGADVVGYGHERRTFLAQSMAMEYIAPSGETRSAKVRPRRKLDIPSVERRHEWHAELAGQRKRVRGVGAEVCVQQREARPATRRAEQAGSRGRDVERPGGTGGRIVVPAA